MEGVLEEMDLERMARDRMQTINEYASEFHKMEAQFRKAELRPTMHSFWPDCDRMERKRPRTSLQSESYSLATAVARTRVLHSRVGRTVINRTMRGADILVERAGMHVSYIGAEANADTTDQADNLEQTYRTVFLIASVTSSVSRG